MKVLLDEDLPHRLRLHIVNHDVQTASYAGFAGFKNGKLIESLTAAGFEVFVTGDKNIPHQQHLPRMPFGTIVVPSQSLPELIECIFVIQAAIDSAKPGGLTELSCEGS